MKKTIILLNKKYFLITVLFILYVLPLLFSPYYYMDDNVRIVTGKPDWGWQGRPLADWLYYALSFSQTHVKDFFPYSLLVGLLILSLLYKKTESFLVCRHKEKIYTILPFLFIIINPFFIQNLSYRYDSLPMILGLIAGILGYLVLTTKLNKMTKITLSMLLIISSLSLYQPCVNAYLVIMFYYTILLNFQNFKSYIKILSKQLLIFITGVLSYNILVLKLLGYGTPRSTLIGIHDIPVVVKKIIFFFHDLFFQLPQMVVILFSFLILSSFYCIMKKAKNKFIAFVSLSGMFLSLWGGLLLIKENVDLPREFPVFGLYCCCLFSFLISMPPYKKLFILLMVILLSINTLYFNYYMYLYQQQKGYESRLENNLVLKIKEDKYLSNLDIYINGKPNYYYEIISLINSDAFAKRMINTSDEWVTRYALYRKGLKNTVLDFKDENITLKNNICFYRIHPYKETKEYDIYIIQEKIEIFLKRTPNLCQE